MTKTCLTGALRVVAALLFLAPALSLAEDQPPLAEMWVIVPKPDHRNEFFAALKEHMAFRAEQGDPREWQTYTPLLGDNLNRVAVRAYSLRRRVLVARARIRYRSDATARDEAIAALESWLEERLERHRGRHQLSVGILEATLLVAGTLLWGFGDLVRFAF